MRDDKRQRILAAATAVFAERDFHRVHVSEVASRAGVGKGTLYLYFPTKDALHRVALEASLERLGGEMVEAATAEAPLAEALERVVLAILRFFWRRQHLLTLALRYEQRNPRRARERRNRVVGAIAELLERHRLGGAPAARHLTAAFLLGLARAAILEHAPEDRPEATAGRVVDLYLHGLTGSARRGRTDTGRGNGGGA
jgi:TetR/AcrR family fatty acid metabolism transcriptional regulator